MRKVGVAPIGLFVLSLALVLAPMAGVGPPTADDPPGEDAIGREAGYGPDEPVAVTREDGLNDSELDIVVSRSMARVETIRSIEFERRVPVEVIGRAEYRRRLADRHGNFSAADRLHQNVKFEALFMIPEDRDAIAGKRSNAGGNVLGYYSIAEERIVIVSADETTPQLNEYTLAQELFHAWQDRRYDLSSYNRSTEERNNAVNGIVEGDANYVQHLYEARCAADWECLTPREGPRGGGDADDDSDGSTGDGSGSGGGLHFGLFTLSYQPYSDGPPFVRDLRRRGEWEAVNAVYEDPPASTEQTIHPDRYGRDAPSWPSIRDRSGPGWRPLQLNGSVNYAEFGEAGLFATFAYPGLRRGGESIIPGHSFFAGAGRGTLDPYNYSHPYSDGWDGDRLLPYVDSEPGTTNETGYVWKTRWDSERDARQFRRGYERLLRHHGARPVQDGVWRIPSGGYADAFRIERDGRDVVITNAPTVDDLAGVRRPNGADTGARLARGTP